MGGWVSVKSAVIISKTFDFIKIKVTIKLGHKAFLYIPIETEIFLRGRVICCATYSMQVDQALFVVQN
jgi:hypothetical protein